VNTPPPQSELSLHAALRCLFIVAMHRNVQIQPEHFSDVDPADIVSSVMRVTRRAGMRAKVIRRESWKELCGLSQALPLMCLMKDGNWFALFKINAQGDTPSVAMLNPHLEAEGVKIMARDAFMEQWSGMAIACKKSKLDFSHHSGPFGFRWFIPDILRYKRYFRDVAIAVLMSAFISFATPLMFQILIDKVITHHSYQTLYAVMIIFVVLTLFDSVFGYVRQYLMTYLTAKIDTRLGTRTFQHLLSLPLNFFESNTAGVLARHMQQTETIRQFLTGRIFHTTLDVMVLPIMLCILFFYSVKLTFVVLGFSIAMAVIIGIMVPTFRRQLEQLYAAEGNKQSHLIETIHGMRTVKSLTLEGARMESWNEKIVSSAKRRQAVGKIAALANSLTHALEKIMQVSVLGLGALDVFDGELSVGALIAFNMVSGRVTGPLVQIVGLINEYQESSLAVKMLGTVMNESPERDPGQAGMTTEITGNLSFENISFRYKPDAPNVLERVSFDVQDGQVIGIVGRSGSGKTTITRLIQGIQTAQEGVVRLDGVDIRHIDLGHLRRSIGVVLQENFLFRGTVRQNIAAIRPDAKLAEIVEAARMAGADEFIDRLPHSYETLIEENGANFSGGQRQRIAIARALLMRPRLLIFDEATSALDPESEVIVQENLNLIARGRTLLIVSHRLTSLAGADAILVLEQGRVVDFAPHEVLLSRCEVYAHLWQQQTRYLKG